MGPALKDGDRILVNKMIKGARLFNVFAALDNKDVTIYRMPGLGHFKRNDVLVFNFPYQKNRWDRIMKKIKLKMKHKLIKTDIAFTLHNSLFMRDSG